MIADTERPSKIEVMGQHSEMKGRSGQAQARHEKKERLIGTVSELKKSEKEDEVNMKYFTSKKKNPTQC